MHLCGYHKVSLFDSTHMIYIYKYIWQLWRAQLVAMTTLVNFMKTSSELVYGADQRKCSITRWYSVL